MTRARLFLGSALCLLLLGQTAFAAEYKQAPALDAAVKDGKLPAVAERLPEAPHVETLVDGIGKYGGTIRTGPCSAAATSTT